MHIGLDLDGTLVSEEKTFEKEFAKPLKKAAKLTSKLHKKGYIVTIFTARSWAEWKSTFYFLKKHKFYFDNLICGKPNFDYYCDNRALSSLDELCNELGIKI